MDKAVPPEVLRETIADVLLHFADEDTLPGVCRRLGLVHPGNTAWVEHGLTRPYLHACMEEVETTQDLIGLAQRVVMQVGSETLDEMLRTLGVRGAHGAFQNLIFAGLGDKPKIVMTDATENRIKLTTNADLWLVYDRPLLASGLSWQALIDWWRTDNPDKTDGLDDTKVSLQLHMRLAQSLPKTSPPQQLFFHAYYARVTRLYPKLGFEQPALIPEVFLHYDPYSQKDPTNPKDLARQRMDFLVLLPNGERVVIEIDGWHHYSTKEALDSGEVKVAAPRLYAQMVAADRELRLDGYEVYRFGGAELPKEQPDKAKAVVNSFFDRLLPEPA
ncbi:hypothetical protein [Streptomyces virginiae]|uniref:hypothetical protein n=1 Tax=Streptomyces virginiae TaxID=1961 RepID=UPI0032441F11